MYIWTKSIIKCHFSVGKSSEDNVFANVVINVAFKIDFDKL